MDVLISTLLDVAIHVSRFTKKKDTHGEETAWRYRRVLVFEAGGSSSVSLSLSLSLFLSFGGYREARVQPRLSLPSNREPAFRVIKELQVVVCSAMCLVIARCHCTARYDTTTNNDLLLSALLSRISSGPVPRNFFMVF